MSDTLPWAEDARHNLGEPLFSYLVGQPKDGQHGAIDPNVEALSRYRLLPRVLQGQPGVDLGTQFVEGRIAAPLAIGAFAGDRLFHPDGLLPIAQVCHDLDLPLFVSEETVTPLPEITALHDRCWLQLRAAGLRERAMALVDTAAAAGARGIILTVLAPTHPVPGLQPGGFSVGQEIATRGWKTIGSTEPGVHPLPSFPGWTASDLALVVRHAERAGLPVMAKGILHPEDVVRVEETGCAGVLVSNIGLRQTWRWVPAVEQLSAVRRAAAGAVLLDGGVRSGTDALVAAALGATAAVATRPVLSALAGGGHRAVRELLSGWMNEMRALTAWCGLASPADLDEKFLVRVEPPGSARFHADGL